MPQLPRMMMRMMGSSSERAVITPLLGNRTYTNDGPGRSTERPTAGAVKLVLGSRFELNLAFSGFKLPPPSPLNIELNLESEYSCA